MLGCVVLCEEACANVRMCAGMFDSVCECLKLLRVARAVRCVRVRVRNACVCVRVRSGANTQF